MSHKRKASAAVEALMGAGVAPRTTRGGTVQLGNKRLTTRDNRLTAAGEAYEARTGSVDNWRVGITLEGTKEYAYRRDGTKVLVRYRDAQGNLVVTGPGRSYFQTHSTQYQVVVYCDKWCRSPNGKWHIGNPRAKRYSCAPHTRPCRSTSTKRS